MPAPKAQFQKDDILSVANLGYEDAVVVTKQREYKVNELSRTDLARVAAVARPDTPVPNGRTSWAHCTVDELRRVLIYPEPSGNGNGNGSDKHEDQVDGPFNKTCRYCGETGLAWTSLGKKANGRTLWRLKTADGALHHKSVGTCPDDRDDLDAESDPEPTSAPEAEPTSNGHGDSGSIDAVLRGIAREEAQSVARQTVNEDRVREIVTGTIEEAIKDGPRVKFDVRINDEPVELPEVHHEKLPTLLRHVAAARLTHAKHPFLVGPAGTGKTTLAKDAAHALRLTYRQMSLGGSDLPSKLVGFVRPTDGVYMTTPLRESWEHGGVILLDEADSASAMTLTTLNDLFSNGAYTFPDQRVERHDDCVIILSGNTYGTGPNREYIGRNQLDAATTDRFAYILVDYDEQLERTLAMAYVPDDVETATRQRVRSWIEMVHTTRTKARESGVKVIVGTRAILAGTALILQGATLDDCNESVLAGSWDTDTRKRLGIGA